MVLYIILVEKQMASISIFLKKRFWQNYVKTKSKNNIKKTLKKKLRKVVTSWLGGVKKCSSSEKRVGKNGLVFKPPYSRTNPK